MKLVYSLLFLLSVPLTAQDALTTKALTKVGKLVQYSEYYSNGKIAQTGYFKGNKRHGLWTSFSANGQKRSMGTYHKGKKVSKWLFWSSGTLIEVEYRNNKIAKTVRWDQSQILAGTYEQQ